ncbi:MAG: alpha-2-macroglobulin family protein [Planctomycetota bacterium]
MRSLFLLAALALIAPRTSHPADWREIRARAESLYAEKSYQLAHEAYAEATTLELGSADRRFLLFRLADTDWRSAASSENPDSTRIERARAALHELHSKVQRPEDKDVIWAEISESLGDYEWMRRDSQNLGGAMPHYQAALDFWAGASDVETARRRWLDIVFRMGWPGRGEEWGQNWWVGQIPIEIAENAMKIAVRDEDRAQAAFLFATVVRQQGSDFDRLRRGLEALDRAISVGRETPWLDDALWISGQWYETQGVPTMREDGTWVQTPDYVKALEVYHRLLREFKKGDTRWRDAAEEAVKRILRAEVSLAVGQAFLPGSEVAYHVSWRNVARVNFAIYPIDLPRDLRFDGRDPGRSGEVQGAEWLTGVDLSRLERLNAWTHETKDTGEHQPGSAEMRLESKLAPGAYVLEARGGGRSARELVLVSSTAIFLKATGQEALLWVTDALTSEPVASADVAFWERYHDGSRWRWVSQTLRTGEDGTVLAKLARQANNSEIFAAASKGERAAFALGGSSWQSRNEDPWKIYAFTDRSTYRPGAAVEWKVVARTRSKGSYATPAGAKIEYEIADPRGTIVGKGDLALNSFGSAWATFDANASLPLGEFNVTFFEPRRDGRRHIGSATLFRLEEYKLPEFEVRVAMGGDGKLFRLGDRVEVVVEANTFYGAPVGNADVEVLVKQSPYWRSPIPVRDFPWLYEDSNLRGHRSWGGGGQVVSRLTVKTDAEGRAQVFFETPRGAGQDQEYTIEARVTDASRREITGVGKVRVANLAYSVTAKAEHNVYRPGDELGFTFEARDANEKPVVATGEVTLVRNRWVEVWIDPAGREVRGRRHERPDEGWKPKFRGYETEFVAKKSLTTDAAGMATLKVPAATEGYFTATWSSRDDRGSKIEASTVAWVASGSTSELGYHAGGLDLVVDKDTFRAGETAPVLVCTPESNRWVLFSVESEVLHSYQVVHVTGTAKLVLLPVKAEHVPNVYLSGLTTSDGDALFDMEQVVVPPIEQFLTVEVTPDKAEILPGGEGTLTVRTLDARGEPLAAEVALSLVDEAVAAIQGEYAGDPRQFFFGERRGIWVRTQSTFDRYRFGKLVIGEDGHLHDERQAILDQLRRDQDGGYKEELGQAKMARGMVGGLADMRSRNEGVYDGPSSAAAPSAARESESKLNYAEASFEKDGEYRQDAGEGGAAGPVQVRTDFRETALWKPDLVTDAQGRATVSVKYPESLTRWKATARVAAADARFGIGTAATRTQKPLIARLQAPRFFVVGDEVTLSGLFDNRTNGTLVVRPELVAEGLDLLTPAPASVAIDANGQARVDWKARVTVSGIAKLRLVGRSGELSDAMEKSYPMEPHGIDALVARALKMKGSEIAFALDVPAARRKETTQFKVQVSPSLAVTMLDALPYLVDYPYGCTEQTLSRFLPAAIVAKTLKDQGLSAEDAMSRVFGGIETETAGASHPRGKKSLAELDRMIREGLERLYDFQHGDGGWGWWKQGDSDPFMTAYVVWGLSLAREAGLDVRTDVIERGANHLSLEIVEAEVQPDLAAWMLHALAVSGRGKGDERADAAFEKLWKDRQGLNAYSRALFALAAKSLGRNEQAKTLAQNLANGAMKDETPDVSRVDPTTGTHHDAAMATVHWGADKMWRRWSEGPVETTAFALRALLAIDPQNQGVRDLAEKSVNWLVQNRRGAQWSNTRDTSIAILALNDWLGKSGEIARDVQYELVVNGKSVARRTVTAKEMLSAPAEFTIAAGDVVDGANEIRVKRIAGDGPLYLAARASFFSLEEPIPARGTQIYVKRQFYKRVGRPTLLKGQIYERFPLEDGGTVASGERVEVVLTLEAKNDFEYLVFEDLKAAGLEAAGLLSGEAAYVRELKSGEVEHRFAGNVPAMIPDPNDHARYTGRQRWVHQELRDRKVALFVDKLPQGVWEIRYELRAEVPGRFHALPTLGHAMYVPEIRCNGAEARLTVTERGVQGE